jgi:hypothetical protein
VTSKLTEMLKEIENVRNRINKVIQVKGLAHQEVLDHMRLMDEKIREYNRLLELQIQQTKNSENEEKS